MIFELFGDAGIEVIDSEQQFDATQRRSLPKAGGQGREEAAEESLEKTNDPVRMYLREMGTVPLLTREGEVEIAKRIEKGQKTVQKALSRSPVVVAEIQRHAQELKEGILNIKNFVLFPEDEITQELLLRRRRTVLRRINEVRKLEAEAARIRRRLRRAKKDTANYKRLLSQPGPL